MSVSDNTTTTNLLEVADKLYGLKASSSLSSLDPMMLVMLALLPLLAFASSRVLFSSSGQGHDKLSHIPYAGGEGSKRHRLREYKARAKKIYSEGYRTFKSLYRVLSPEGTFQLILYFHSFIDGEFLSLADPDLVEQETMSAFRIICLPTMRRPHRKC